MPKPKELKMKLIQKTVLLLLITSSWIGAPSLSHAAQSENQSVERWVQEHGENAQSYESFVLTIHGENIVGGHGQSMISGKTLETKIETCEKTEATTCQLQRSDGKHGSLKVISRDATTMKATVAYLTPGQTQTWMPPILVFKKNTK
jgi:hypothetical protein